MRFCIPHEQLLKDIGEELLEEYRYSYAKLTDLTEHYLWLKPDSQRIESLDECFNSYMLGLVYTICDPNRMIDRDSLLHSLQEVADLHGWDNCYIDVTFVEVGGTVGYDESLNELWNKLYSESDSSEWWIIEKKNGGYGDICVRYYSGHHMDDIIWIK